jgi:cytoskeletal protein CcmA (bactofilin family)
VISEGVFFEGNCKMGTSTTTTPSRPEKSFGHEDKKPETVQNR